MKNVIGLFCVMASVYGAMGNGSLPDGFREAPEKYWQMAALEKAPSYRPCTESDSQWPGMKALYVQGKGPNGAAAEFFAYYATPDEAAPKGGYPAVVLVHGGGGTAFPQYVDMWRKLGFAVIAPDWYNQRPQPKLSTGALLETNIKRAPLAGGKRQDHVANVANMVLAHSLIRSFPEVNKDRTVFVGLSWGSWYGAMVAAVDARFKGVCEIYCGGVYPWQTNFTNGRFLHAAKVPIYWDVGTNDQHAPPLAINYALEECPKVFNKSLIPRIPHSHCGFKFANTQRMARYFVGLEDKPLPKLGAVEVKDGVATAKILEVGKGVTHGEIAWTEDFEIAPFWHRLWQRAPATIKDGVVSAVVPKKALRYFLMVYEGEKKNAIADLCASTEYVLNRGKDWDDYKDQSKPTLDPATLQVSPNGLTPHAALAKIRAVKKVGSRAKWVVRVAPGRYEFDEPLIFTPEDSGTDKANVSWIGEKGKTLFTGLKKLGGWKACGDIWEAAAPRDKNGKVCFFESLYVNGKRAARAAYPKNHGGIVPFGGTCNEAQVTPHVKAYWEESFVLTNKADKAVLDAIPANDWPFISLCVRNSWAFSRRQMQGYDAKGGRVFAHNLARKWTGIWNKWNERALCAFENVRTAFTEKGEWFLDVPNGKILYRPLPGEKIETALIEAPLTRMPTLICFKGEPKKGKYVRNIVFQNIAIEGSACRPYLPDANGSQVYMYQAAIGMEGCVQAVGLQGATFLNCAIRHTENHGMRFDAGCTSNCIARCVFEDLGAGGIRMGDNAHGVPPAGKRIERRQIIGLAPESTAFNWIEDCVFKQGGRFNPEGAGVVLANVSDTLVTHCEISDFFYSGVSVGWVWGYAGSVSQRNKITFNHIWNLGQGVMSDMGGVYTLGTSFGTVVSNNVIHDIYSKQYGGWGLYTDEGSEGIIMENNLVYNTDDGGFHQHYGVGCLIRNNIFAWNRRNGIIKASNPNREGWPSTLNVAGNIFVTKNSPLIGSGTYRTGGVWAANVWYDFGGAGDFDKRDWKGWQDLRHEYGGIYADPLFENAQKNDFRLKPNSPALALGFKEFDFSAAGVRGEK